MRKSSHALALWLSRAGLCLVVGCTHQDPADRSLEKLRADIARIEADRDRLDQRVGALEAEELRRHETPQAATPPAAAPKTPTEPARSLPVVRVGENETPARDTGDGDLRSVVQAGGSRRPTERAATQNTTKDAVAFSSEAKRDYEAALALARGKQYDKALQGFTAFLVRFPDHPYAENAMYWRGECFYATGAFGRAVEQFEGLVARFPYGNKASDALLKLGLAQEKAGMKEQAQKTFAELKDRYPKSDAARQVPNT